MSMKILGPEDLAHMEFEPLGYINRRQLMPWDYARVDNVTKGTGGPESVRGDTGYINTPNPTVTNVTVEPIYTSNAPAVSYYAAVITRANKGGGNG